MIDESRNGITKNLDNQINAFFDKCNIKSYGTRKRYRESNLRFAKFLGNNFHLQKMKNVEARHVYAYVTEMKEKGWSPYSMQSEMSGIRFLADYNGNTNILPSNEDLQLPKRSVGKEDKSWLPVEIDRFFDKANFQGRMDIVISGEFMIKFGLRLDEAASLKLSYLMRALNYNQLMVTGKGGKVRVITFEYGSEQEEIIKKWLGYAKAGGKYPGDYLLCENVHRSVEKLKKSMENWLTANKAEIIEPNRSRIKEGGKKPRSENITLHGLRHTYAQRYMAELSYMRPKDRKKTVSFAMGHNRITTTHIYDAIDYSAKNKD